MQKNDIKQSQNSSGIWRACTKKEICEHKTFGKKNLRASMIKPNTSDPEYLDNWVEKLDMLCESKQRLGLMGSAYFVGILTAMIIVPQLSDSYGRKNIFVVTMGLTLFC